METSHYIKRFKKEKGERERGRILLPNTVSLREMQQINYKKKILHLSTPPLNSENPEKWT